MAKQRGGKPAKKSNVFKVAGARSLKVKNKAKAVSMKLKSLNEATKQKLNEVDEQLLGLEAELRQQTVTVDKNVVHKEQKAKKQASNAKTIQDHMDCEATSAEALLKLDKMEV